MDILIRNARTADAEPIAQMNLRLAEETEALKLDPATVHAGVRALLDEPARGLYFLAEVKGRIAGQAMITYEWSDWRNGNIWWLQSVYVHAEFRRAGVFRKLFEHIRALAQADGRVCGLRLYMHEDNERASRAYAGLGMLATHYRVFELPVTASGG